MGVELRHCAKFRDDRSSRCRDIAIFGFLKIDSGRRHVCFSKFEIFNGQKGRTAALCQISSKSLKRDRDMAIFRFFQDGGVRHLGFVMRVLGPPTEGIWWSLSLCQICLHSMQWF